VDIADQPGMLAAVATLLAVHSINIRNIGIVHNREYERGTMRIEFHEEKDISVATHLLQMHGYVVS
jgi:prephenate dehydrogenase